MTRKLLCSVALAIVLSACNGMETRSQLAQSFPLPEGISKIDSVEKKDNEIVIPYTKYKLENGLTVILHPDKSDPLVHVDVTYHVGSGREEIGKSGFAHFFEHMMFQGSENVEDEEHFRLITEAGGTLNGSTNSDRTNYYQTIPSNQLEKILWLEADRMGYFLDAVTQKKFENQRETVKNERGQRVDNRPYGLLFERVGEAQFPEGHPYSWSTIGYLEDLDRANLDDLKRFFLRWYGPNNAVLTIGGDFDAEKTLKDIQKYFGPIPMGAEVEDPVYVPVTLEEDRYISLEDNVQLPLLYMSWPTVHLNHPDEAPLDVLMSIMGSGQTSLLYKNLEKPGLVVQSSAGHGCRELNCSFTLFGLANPAKIAKLSDLETIIRDTLEEFETRGVEDDDLTRVKAGIVSDMIYGLESVSGKVSQLAAYETYRNTPNGIRSDIERYENVTKADVMRVYAEYIKDKPAVIMSIVPKGQIDKIARADTWKRYERDIPENTETSSIVWAPMPDDFDRSIMPPAGPNPSIKVPNVYNVELENGIKVLGAINEETPTTSISIRIKAGQSHEGLDLLGTASMTANMLNEATLESSAEDISNRLDKLGSSVSISGGDRYTTLYIRALTQNLDETIAIAAERLFKPKFDEADFERLKAQTIQGIKAAKKQPDFVANSVFNKKLFGDNNPMSFPNAGTEASVEKMTLADVKAFYRSHYAPNITSIVSVSDLDKAAMSAALSPFKSWSGEASTRPDSNAFPELDAPKIYLVDKENAAQSEIRIGKRALPFDATGEYFKAGLMNYPLGGNFNSRINLNLREDKDYTYGARSTFNGQKDRGYFQASSAVRADVTVESITEFLKEIKAYHKDGITMEELAFTKSAIGQRDARSYETPGQKLGFLSEMMSYNLAPDFVDEQNQVLSNLTKSDVDRLAKKYLNTDEMIMVVVGDMNLVFDKLESLALPIEVINADGEPIEE